jgi:two-component sensor histidine kinase
MSTVHEKLYRSESLSKIDFQDYLKSFISHLRTSFRTTGDIVNTTDAAGIELSLDLAVPCGLIVNELVTNSMKYAFPEGKPGDQRESECKIIVSMKDEDGRYTLSVGDNGRGLPVDLDWRETRSLGLRLVRMLGEHQLGGTVDLDNTFGAHFTIQFDTLPGEK